MARYGWPCLIETILLIGYFYEYLPTLFKCLGCTWACLRRLYTRVWINWLLLWRSIDIENQFYPSTSSGDVELLENLHSDWHRIPRLARLGLLEMSQSIFWFLGCLPNKKIHSGDVAGLSIKGTLSLPSHVKV